MKKSFSNSALKLVVVAVFSVFLVSAGYLVGSAGYQLKKTEAGAIKPVRELPIDHKALDFTLFWSVWDDLQEAYYDKEKLNTQAMVYGAIKGMVEAVGDPYTVFLPPQENKVVQEDLQGSFDGVGIQIGYKGTQLAVIAPLPESPAAEAGVRPGDYILAITDKQKGIDRGTVGLTLPEAVQMIRGPKGSTVSLTLGRDGEDSPLVLDIKRETIDVPSVVLTNESDGKLARLQLLKFGGETKSEWDKAVQQVLSGGYSGIILDLRNNPGGYLDGSIDVASEFMTSGVVVREEGSLNGNKEYKVSKAARLSSIPMVVMVNSGSASASEIVAGALKDSGRAKVVGTKTFGKGTIQEPRQVGNGAGLHVTIAKWLTPGGTWVHGEGLKPDVEVEDNTETDNDEQLEKAIELLVAI